MADAVRKAELRRHPRALARVGAVAIARAELAATSRARKQAAEADQKRQTDELMHRIRTIAPRTDNMMDTEAAAIARQTRGRWATAP